MISHEARQVVEKASHEAIVDKASHEAMVEKASHTAIAGKAMADLTDSSQMAAENGEEASYLPSSSEQRAARSQKNDAQSQLTHTYETLKTSRSTMKPREPQTLLAISSNSKLARQRLMVISKGFLGKTTESSSPRAHSSGEVTVK